VVDGVAVVVTGEATGAPDIARANIGVEARAPDAREASRRATELMSAVLTAMKTMGIAEKDLRTHSYSVNFEHDHFPPPPPEPPPPPGPRPASEPRTAATEVPSVGAPRGEYRVQNMVEVTIRNLEGVGAILAKATEGGANQIWGVQFELDSSDKLEDEARDKAVADAKRRAEQLARLGGVTLGPIYSISEIGGGSPVPFAPMAVQAKGMEDVPVERGQIRIEKSVQLVFRIERH
jgi:uncharacterized protein YggE